MAGFDASEFEAIPPDTIKDTISVIVSLDLKVDQARGVVKQVSLMDTHLNQFLPGFDILIP